MHKYGWGYRAKYAETTNSDMKSHSRGTAYLIPEHCVRCESHPKHGHSL